MTPEEEGCTHCHRSASRSSLTGGGTSPPRLAGGWEGQGGAQSAAKTACFGVRGNGALISFVTLGMLLSFSES